MREVGSGGRGRARNRIATWRAPRCCPQPLRPTTTGPGELTYDLVLLAHLHVPEGPRRTAVRRAAASVVPGGRLLVVGHHADNLDHGVGGPASREVLYDERDLGTDLADRPEGLTVRTARRVEREVAGNDRPAIDVLLEAERAGLGC